MLFILLGIYGCFCGHFYDRFCGHFYDLLKAEKFNGLWLYLNRIDRLINNPDYQIIVNQPGLQLVGKQRAIEENSLAVFQKISDKNTMF